MLCLTKRQLDSLLVKVDSRPSTIEEQMRALRQSHAAFKVCVGGGQEKKREEEGERGWGWGEGRRGRGGGEEREGGGEGEGGDMVPSMRGDRA